ncbi:MAG: dihydrofolate reductase [Enterocloster sp.]
MNLIAAADRHWAIGRDGRLLVTIPADQQMFLRETVGKVVVMGRKTLESLPGGQPLSRRINVVLSRDEQFHPKGVHVCRSLEEALEYLKQYRKEDIYVIGGQSIYEQFLPYCSTAHVTSIDYVYDADTYLPDLDQDPQWELTEEGEEQTYFSLCYTFRKYQRK